MKRKSFLEVLFKEIRRMLLTVLLITCCLWTCYTFEFDFSVKKRHYFESKQTFPTSLVNNVVKGFKLVKRFF